MPLQRYIISNRQTWKRSSNSSPWYRGRREGSPCSTVERVGIFRLFKRFIWPLDLYSSCSCRHPLQRVGSSGSHTVKSNTNKVCRNEPENELKNHQPTLETQSPWQPLLLRKSSRKRKELCDDPGRAISLVLWLEWDLNGPIRIHIAHSFLSFFGLGPGTYTPK